MSTSPVFTTEFQDQLDALLKWRRDVRHFSRDPVPADIMDRVLQSTYYAPSVGNSRPWQFVRIKSPTVREALAQHVDEEIYAAGSLYKTDEAQRTLYHSLKLHGLREAPEIIAVFSQNTPDRGAGLGRKTMPATLAYSTILAIHTLWLTTRAHDIGLGWVSILDPSTVSTLLDAPQDWQFIALLCLGYPTKTSDEPELQRQGWQTNSDWHSHVSEH